MEVRTVFGMCTCIWPMANKRKCIYFIYISLSCSWLKAHIVFLAATQMKRKYALRKKFCDNSWQPNVSLSLCVCEWIFICGIFPPLHVCILKQIFPLIMEWKYWQNIFHFVHWKTVELNYMRYLACHSLLILPCAFAQNDPI